MKVLLGFGLSNFLPAHPSNILALFPSCLSLHPTMANSWPAPPTRGHLTGGIGTKKPPAPKSLSPDKHRADGSGAAYRAGTSVKSRRGSQPRRENGQRGSVGPMSAAEGRAVPCRAEPSRAERGSFGAEGVL